MSSATGTKPTDEHVLNLMVEELVVARRLVAGDTVRISTVTNAIEREIDEVLAHQRVDVERVAVRRYVDTVPGVREEDGVTIIPVIEEVLVVERRLLLTEEVRIRRRRVEERHVETAVLRMQEAVVTRTSPNTYGERPGLPTQQTTSAKPQGHMHMTQETIVAIYDTAAHAAAAVRDLEEAGIPSSEISQHAKGGSVTNATTQSVPAHDKGFWASLFGSEPDHDTAVYGRSIDNGGTVVTVKVAAEMYDRAASILEEHHPIDIDERSASYGLAGSGTTGTAYGAGGHAGLVEPARSTTESGAIEASGMTAHSAATGTTNAAGLGVGMEQDSGTLQLAEESLNVGKRAVQGGTTRLRRFVTSKPVEEQVTLHSEKVVLDRHPVADGRVLANADFADKTIAMTEMNEEAVVSKSARVVEEIGLRKEAVDRVETIKDTVRRDDVEVEQVPTTDRFATNRTTPVDHKI